MISPPLASSHTRMNESGLSKALMTLRMWGCGPPLRNAASSLSGPSESRIAPPNLPCRISFAAKYLRGEDRRAHTGPVLDYGTPPSTMRQTCGRGGSHRPVPRSLITRTFAKWPRPISSNFCADANYHLAGGPSERSDQEGLCGGRARLGRHGAPHRSPTAGSRHPAWREPPLP
jgi:hypothetical protein